MIESMKTQPQERRAVDRRLRELAFLHEIAQLATLARDWDELMRTIVDRTTAAMDVQVCSFYLSDRERTRLTLAATNGLDRTQVGKISLPFGNGITGRVAAGREAIAVDDVTLSGLGEESVQIERHSADSYLHENKATDTSSPS